MADWQVGDLALCIRGPIHSNIRLGGVYRVEGIKFGICWAGGVTALGLVLDGVTHPVCEQLYGFSAVSANAFRKITPGAKIEGIEEPRRVKVDA